jgi:2-oxo-3-hexenedioate decarboxylase
MWNDRAEEELVAELLQARDTARITPSPSQRGIHLDLETGYRVGNELHHRLSQRGFQAVGRKIGFTNRATWEQFDVHQPVWAHMYAQAVHFAHGGSQRLALTGMVAPRLEPEIVLKLRHAVPSGDPSVEDLARCLEWVAIGFEIVDSHYPGWRFTAPEAVADFGMHAALVIGTPWHVGSENPQYVATSLRTLQVTLRGSNDFLAEGKGENALGSPLLALGFLQRLLATQPWAPPLIAGEVITTGTLTSLPYLRHGESYRVEVTGAPLAPLQLEVVA